MGQIPAELAGITPALIVIIGALRQGALLPDRWTPLVAVAGGAGIGVAFAVTASIALLPAVLGGVIAGGAAVGLHQVGKQLQS